MKEIDSPTYLSFFNDIVRAVQAGGISIEDGPQEAVSVNMSARARAGRKSRSRSHGSPARRSRDTVTALLTYRTAERNPQDILSVEISSDASGCLTRIATWRQEDPPALYLENEEADPEDSQKTLNYLHDRLVEPVV